MSEYIKGSDSNGEDKAVSVNKGNQFSVSDPLLEISFERVSGYETITIEGENMSIASLAPSDIWSHTGELQYLSIAETMNISSTVAEDTIAGIGMRTILISGLDDNYNQISETVEMNGTTDVLTNNAYLRVYSITGVDSGAELKNVGIISVISSSSVTVQSIMPVGMSVSKNSHFTVPAGKQFVIVGAELNATKLSGGVAPIIIINALFRSDAIGAPWISAVNRRIDTSVVDQLIIGQPISNLLDEKHDLRFFANTDQNDTEVRIRYYGVLNDK